MHGFLLNFYFLSKVFKRNYHTIIFFVFKNLATIITASFAGKEVFWIMYYLFKSTSEKYTEFMGKVEKEKKEAKGDNIDCPQRPDAHLMPSHTHTHT